MIALLGRDPGPTDGVREYCERLGEALAPLSRQLQLVRVPWDQVGRLRALRALSRQAPDWRGDWIVLQYTALGWSRTGIPLLALVAAAIARKRNARLGVVFHDSVPYDNPGLVGFIRRNGQTAMMRGLYRLSQVSIVTLPVEAATWLPDRRKAVTVPVGSNVAPPGEPPARPRRKNPHAVVAVFGVTGGDSRDTEVRLIAQAVSEVRKTIPDLKVVFLGSGTVDATFIIRANIPSPCEIRGVVEAREVHRVLQSADAGLFVRGAVASGRTTAVSAIVAGTPVVGFLGPTTGQPVTAAGVRLVPLQEPEALAEALRSVLTDERTWAELHERNLRATKDFFSWSAVARKVADVLPA